MQKKIHVIRNTTVEHLFKDIDHISFSGYGDISNVETADIYIWFYTYPIKNDPVELINEISDYREKLGLIIKGIPETKPLFLITLYNPESRFKFENNGKIRMAADNYNRSLFELSEDYSNVKVIDLSEVLNRFREDEILDFRHYYLSQIVISPSVSEAFSLWIRKKTDIMLGKRKKCIVVDLDNTLWGGILGEDLIEGINLNEEYPGICYLDFQNLLLKATEYGIILAICSKNNRSDVEELWKKHPFMKLKEDNFSASRINWDDKATNIRGIAEDLNIGLDSLVFIDDNPVERDLVKSILPEVSTPEFPRKPYLLRKFFIEMYNEYFQSYKLSDEDRKKVEQYRQMAQRNKERGRYVDIGEYIKDLDIEIEIHRANDFNLPRISQMTQKTNQFNLTTIRYTEEDLREKIRNGSFIACAGVSDRFGDNGNTIGIIVDFEDDHDTAIIDSYFLSCRILGRKIEFAFIKKVINLLHEEFGTETILARYIPTRKNGQTRDFFEKLNFELIDTDDKGIKNYQLEINSDSLYRIDESYNIGVNI